MRDPERIDRILNKLQNYWKKCPDLRLCQILGNFFGVGDHYYQEDDKLEKILDMTSGDLENGRWLLLYLNESENKAIDELSKLQDLPPEKVVIQALRMYQLKVMGSNTLNSLSKANPDTIG